MSESFSELETLWEQAGGSDALAPYAAETAEIESSGEVDAYNASGATGLWQIEYPSNADGFTQAELQSDAADNAAAAVKLSGDTQAGLVSNWTNFETLNGVQATEASVAAAAAARGGTNPDTPPSATAPSTTPSTAPASSSGSGTGTATQISALQAAGGFGVMSLISDMTGLLRDIATVIDYAFGMFGRGQGWRLAFTLVFAASGYGAYRCLAGAGAVPDMGGPKLAVIPV